MPKKVAPLTDTRIKNASPKDKEYNLSDGNGLLLRIKPNGGKHWYFNYSHPITKKRNVLGLGSYPAVKLKRARELREEYRELIAAGKDPKQARIEADQEAGRSISNNFEKVALEWIEDIKPTRSEKTHLQDLSRLQKDIFPMIGSRAIKELKAPELVSALDPLKARGASHTAKRLANVIKRIMDFALLRGYIDANPASVLSQAFGAPPQKHFPTIKPSELPKLLEDMENASNTMQTSLLFKFQLHTMVRPNEASNAKWSEIDFEQMTWTIPIERMKKKREHIVFLTPQTKSILEQMFKISGRRVYIFPNRNDPRKPMTSQTVNKALGDAGYKGRLVAHGLRGLASTTLNESDENFKIDAIEMCLAHVESNAVRAAYNRAEYKAERKRIYEWWSQHIQSAGRNKRIQLGT